MTALTATGFVRDGALADIRETDAGSSVFIAGELTADELIHISRIAREQAANAERRAKPDTAMPQVVSPAGCM